MQYNILMCIKFAKHNNALRINIFEYFASILSITASSLRASHRDWHWYVFLCIYGIKSLLIHISASSQHQPHRWWNFIISPIMPPSPVSRKTTTKAEVYQARNRASARLSQQWISPTTTNRMLYIYTCPALSAYPTRRASVCTTLI